MRTSTRFPPPPGGNLVMPRKDLPPPLPTDSTTTNSELPAHHHALSTCLKRPQIGVGEGHLTELATPLYPITRGCKSHNKSHDNRTPFRRKLWEFLGTQIRETHCAPVDLGRNGKVREDLETEREGFEPSTEVASCNSLAGSRFQPLSHLSRGSTRVPSVGRSVRSRPAAGGV